MVVFKLHKRDAWLKTLNELIRHTLQFAANRTISHNHHLIRSFGLKFIDTIKRLTEKYSIVIFIYRYQN